MKAVADGYYETKGKNMNTMIAGVVRALLGALGGWVVQKGWIDEETLTQVVGALIVIATAAWSIWAKRSAAKK